MTLSAKSKRPRPRIESLSDLVFGLALPVGTISLISRMPSSPVRIVYDIAEFGFSFLTLITVWISYTSITSVLPLEYVARIILNVILLFVLH
jgi:hypothetical protein